MARTVARLLRSTAFRIALAFAVTVALTTTLVFGAAYTGFYRSSVALLRTVLRDEVSKAHLLPTSQLRAQLALRLTQDLRHLDYVGLYDPQGARVYGNVPDAITVPADAQPRLLHDVPSPMPTATTRKDAIFVAETRPDGGTLVLGRSLVDVDNLEVAMLRGFIATLGPVVFIAFVLATLVSRRALRRLAAIEGAIGRVMAGELAARLPTKGSSDDIDALASAVNRMLDEIGRLVGQIASVGDNIAHDLRAPLAVIQARLERGLASASGDVLRGAASDALTDLQRAMTTVSALLRVSALEGGLRRGAFGPLDLVEVSRDVFELFQPVAQDKGVRMAFAAPRPVLVTGDGELLREAVANLVDNAVKFTPSGGDVSIACGLGGVLLRIGDNGPGIDPAEHLAIFKRFHRGARTAHAPGHGMGLSMAATIADLHGFDLRVRDNDPGAVFELAVRAPPTPAGRL